jgi:hypothetical protein
LFVQQKSRQKVKKKNYFVLLFALRQRSLQYFTSSQMLCHFFLQVKGRLQTGQILVGRFDFLWGMN